METEESAVISSGVEGLDEVLKGGLVRNRLYLVEGTPGSGKTTMALQFLRERVRNGEACLFVSLSESKHELEHSAKIAHDWDLNSIRILEIMASEVSLNTEGRYTMFHPSEVELSETIKLVLAEADRIKPRRLVFDSLSE